MNNGVDSDQPHDLPHVSFDLAKYPGVVITGASGFLGKHLIENIQSSGVHIRALSRSKKPHGIYPDNVEWIPGDINNSNIWKSLLIPGCLVVNLAYSHVTAHNDALLATRNMINAFSGVGIKRLVHCSTLSVYGNAAKGLINESTECTPINEYGRVKLEIDRIFLNQTEGKFETVILRPGSVFGTGGQALLSMCHGLTKKVKLLSYLKSCLFNKRRLHLVSVENVISAIVFLSDAPRNLIENEVFIVSEDEHPKNNFRDVEELLMSSFETNYTIPRMPLPSVLLRILLGLNGSAEVDPHCYYSSDKIRRAGFEFRRDFSDAVQVFGAHYKNSLKA